MNPVEQNQIQIPMSCGGKYKKLFINLFKNQN